MKRILIILSTLCLLVGACSKEDKSGQTERIINNTSWEINEDYVFRILSFKNGRCTLSVCNTFGGKEELSTHKGTYTINEDGIVIFSDFVDRSYPVHYWKAYRTSELKSESEMKITATELDYEFHFTYYKR